jgi:hypothetical protein
MMFSKWLENKVLSERKAPQPVQAPKTTSKKVGLSKPSPQRQRSGRRNTSFEAEKGRKGEEKRRAISEE